MVPLEALVNDPCSKNPAKCEQSAPQHEENWVKKEGFYCVTPCQITHVEQLLKLRQDVSYSDFNY